MPIKSKAQMRKLYALEAEGKLPEGTVKKWLKKYGKPTEERVEKTAADDWRQDYISDRKGHQTLLPKQNALMGMDAIQRINAILMGKKPGGTTEGGPAFGAQRDRIDDLAMSAAGSLHHARTGSTKKRASKSKQLRRAAVSDAMPALDNMRWNVSDIVDAVKSGKPLNMDAMNERAGKMVEQLHSVQMTRKAAKAYAPKKTKPKPAGNAEAANNAVVAGLRASPAFEKSKPKSKMSPLSRSNNEVDKAELSSQDKALMASNTEKTASLPVSMSPSAIAGLIHALKKGALPAGALLGAGAAGGLVGKKIHEQGGLKEQSAALNDVIAAEHGLKAANMRSRGFLKGGLTNTGDVFRSAGAALTGKIPLVAITPKQLKKVEAWHKDLAAKRVEKTASDEDGKPAKPAPGFSVVGKRFSDARRNALKKQKPTKKSPFEGKKAWEVPYSPEATKYFADQISDSTK